MNGSLYQIMKVIEDGGDQVYTNYAIDIEVTASMSLQGRL